MVLFQQYCKGEAAEPPFSLPQELEGRIHYDQERLVHGPYQPLREFAAPVFAATANGSGGGSAKEGLFARQMESLERIAKSLRSKLDTDNRMQVAEARRLVKEQSILLRQYNDYKRMTKGGGVHHPGPAFEEPKVPHRTSMGMEGRQEEGGSEGGRRGSTAGESLPDFLTEEGLLIQGTYKKVGPTTKAPPKNLVVLPPLFQM
jgi:hypothetical protein